jgi:membrane fusion protein (multidrug efflux system)
MSQPVPLNSTVVSRPFRPSLDPVGAARRSSWLSVLLMTILIGTHSLALADSPKQEAKPASRAAQSTGGGKGGSGAAQGMPVGTITVKTKTVPLRIETIGQAEGSREIEVRARVAGILEKRVFQEGQRVKAGTKLYQIERIPFEIALTQALASLAQEQARNEQARREASRLQPLAEKQAVSRREYDDAASAVRSSDAALASAKARVREAELNLSYTSVTAPIAGITGRSIRSEGALVNAGSDSLLTTIMQTDPVWVRFSFSEAQYALLRSGRLRQIQALSADGRTLSTLGKLNFSASNVDPRLGTIAMRAEFPNPDLSILPGQFVRAQVQIGERQAFLVPQVAVMQNDKGRFVWTINDEGKATPTPVKAAEWQGKDWVIESGLKNGDAVIIDNLIKLRPGAAVRGMPRPATQEDKQSPAASAQSSADAKAARQSADNKR